jgi:hypothetical protein
MVAHKLMPENAGLQQGLSKYLFVLPRSAQSGLDIGCAFYARAL